MENVITLSILIGLLLFCPPPHRFAFENSKNTRNELARPVMGTIFLDLGKGSGYVRLSLKVVHLPIVAQVSLRYFHPDRISVSFTIHRLSSHMLLAAAEKRFRLA